MAFDSKKDKQLLHEVLGEDLHISVHQYNGGDPKFQIGPREVTKKDGTTSFFKAGRLSADEFNGIMKLKKEILQVLAKKG